MGTLIIRQCIASNLRMLSYDVTSNPNLLKCICTHILLLIIKCVVTHSSYLQFFTTVTSNPVFYSTNVLQPIRMSVRSYINQYLTCRLLSIGIFGNDLCSILKV